MSRTTVICLCYNQRDFVREAIESVWAQEDKLVELIVVDDASTDGSKEEIKNVLKGTDVPFINLNKRRGHCAAFNLGLKESAGDYIIDLAADDVLLPQRVLKGVQDFQKAGSKAGVHFSDAYICDEAGVNVGTHDDLFNIKHRVGGSIPTGNIYLPLIARYFICPPTMMMRREVLDKLQGYDERLAYEDFDFWIRSARDFQYIHHQAPLVKKRMVRKSDSVMQVSFRSKHSLSTFKVCEKIFHLNINKEEDLALVQRCFYEIKQCFKTLNVELIVPYIRLLHHTKKRSH